MKFAPPSSALIRNSIECPQHLGVVVPELLAGRDPEHLADQVEPVTSSETQCST
jgi:hypothetical protein